MWGVVGNEQEKVEKWKLMAKNRVHYFFMDYWLWCNSSKCRRKCRIFSIEEETSNKMGKIMKEDILCSCCYTVFIIGNVYSYAGGTNKKYYDYIVIARICFSLLSSMVNVYFTNVGSDAPTSLLMASKFHWFQKLASSHILKDKYALVHGMYEVWGNMRKHKHYMMNVLEHIHMIILLTFKEKKMKGN